MDNPKINRWKLYFEKNKNRAMRPLLQKGLELLQPGMKTALDIGCGVGIEVQALLSQGLTVFALDPDPEAIGYLKSKFPTELSSDGKLHTISNTAENLIDWPSVDFIFSYHAFPFCKSGTLLPTLERSLTALNSNGLFVGSFFGPEDEWVQIQKSTGITIQELRTSLKNFKIISFEEIIRTGPDVAGNLKNWHIFEVIAQKN